MPRSHPTHPGVAVVGARISGRMWPMATSASARARRHTMQSTRHNAIFLDAKSRCLLMGCSASMADGRWWRPGA
eukprot:5946859-Prymnesium_polylepis.1